MATLPIGYEHDADAELLSTSVRCGTPKPMKRAPTKVPKKSSVKKPKPRKSTR